MPVSVRIALILAGFAVVFGADFVYQLEGRRRASTPPHEYNVALANAKVLGMRIGGTVLILLGLAAWVVSNLSGKP